LEATEPADSRTEELPLRDAARKLAKDTPEGRTLEEKLEAFDKADETARKKDAPKIRKDIADIVACVVTEANHRREFLDALTKLRNDPQLAECRNDPQLAASTLDERRQRHPLVEQIRELVRTVLAELGKEMLIEALCPGLHLLLPPTDFVASVFTALQMLEIASPTP
jgi:hypothetical protein